MALSMNAHLLLLLLPLTWYSYFVCNCCCSVHVHTKWSLFGCFYTIVWSIVGWSSPLISCCRITKKEPDFVPFNPTNRAQHRLAHSIMQVRGILNVCFIFFIIRVDSQKIVCCTMFFFFFISCTRKNEPRTTTTTTRSSRNPVTKRIYTTERIVYVFPFIPYLNKSVAITDNGLCILPCSSYSNSRRKKQCEL